MPHQCTGCGRQFADGSKEMLSGCPGCGGTKFQYLPASEAGETADDGTASPAESGAADAGAAVESDAEPGPADPGGEPEPPAPPERPESAVAETVGSATAKLRKLVRSDPGEFGADGTVMEEGPAGEDGAQSSARSEVVGTDELPDRAPGTGGTSFGDPAAGAADGDGPGTPAGSGGAAADPDSQGAGPPVDGDREGQVVDTPGEDRPDLAELREELNDQFEGIRITEPGQYELNLMELYEREETIVALQENGRYVIEPPESWRGDP